MNIRSSLIKILPIATLLWVLLMFVSLKYGTLDRFFFDAMNAHVQGIDYFAMPRAFLNLLNGRSIFDTWGGVQYGPYATWYLEHPIDALIFAWFAFFSPWTSYCLFAIVQVGVLAYSGHLIAKQTSSELNKRLAYFLILCSFPTYWLLYVGNPHSPVVLALVCIFISMYRFANIQNTADEKTANQYLYAGLLISLLTKPIVLLMLPVLLITKRTRKTTLTSLGIYVAISLIFVFVPILNPQSVGFGKLIHVMFNFGFMKNELNIYKNNFVLNGYMKDNAMHWFNLIAQSDYRLMHVDVFSLPVFMDTLAGKQLNPGIYKIPIYITLLLSCVVPFIKDTKAKFQSILLLMMAISISFFLSYNTVWEYQYVSALPVVAFLPLLWDSDTYYKKLIPAIFITGLFFYLPSFYFMVHGEVLTTGVLTLIHFDKVLPSLFIFILLIIPVISLVLKQLIIPFIRSMENIEDAGQA